LLTGKRQSLGRGYRWWDRRWEFGKAFTRGDYFVFLEEGSAVRAAGLMGPGETPISLAEMGERPWRFRSSGIAAGNFLRAAPRVHALGPEGVTPAGRRSRRAQLLEAFKEAPLPLIDFFIKEGDEELPFLRSLMTPGSWYWIGVRPRGTSDDRLPVYLGSPETGADLRSPRSLQFLEAVPPFFEYRLRDIFSLAHILDAGEEEGFGGEGTPPPDKPRDGDEPGSEPLALQREVRHRRLLSGEA
jgi:hypothetical protein